MTLRCIPLADTDDVTALLASARYVMFDFDGPLADLFAGLEAPQVARALVERIKSWNRVPSPLPLLTRPYDPLQVLLDVAEAYRDSEHDHRIAELEKLLAEQELVAAASARPTPYADNLVRRLVARGKVVSVTTNNSAAAATGYLTRRQLVDAFGGHIHGRAADPSLMKPDPHCLTEALRTTGARPEECLMIGDSPHDCLAASALRITFLGYAKNVRKREDLEASGAGNIVDSLKLVFDAAADA